MLSVLQPPAYATTKGWSTFIVTVLAGGEDRLCLPSQSVEVMEGQEMAYAILQECSAGQPKYHIEVYYDGEGKCYFRDKGLKFFVDYGVHAGWFLLFTHRNGMQDFFIRVFDGTFCACSIAAWS
jgi:hypothetical protein